MNDQDFSLKGVFGIVSQALENSETRILKKSGVRLQSVLDRIQDGEPDGRIQKDLKLGSKELANVHAWFARFGGDANAPAPLPAGPKFFLLDECMPASLLPQVKGIFGFSSHVAAEGWARLNPSETVRAMHRKEIDAGIAGFALEHEFSGIMTRDSDFITLSKRPDHPASKIHIFLFNGPWQIEDLRETIRTAATTIQHILAQPPRVHRIDKRAPLLIA